MEANVYQADGREAGRRVPLDPAIFDVTPSDHAIWLDVRAIQAAARQGTHKAKERAETAGSTRKLYRQKGTGNARAGSAKSPIRKSGGTTFGPRPRDYTLRINRKTKRLARRSALTYKAREDALRVIEGLALDVPSTRRIAELLRVLELEHSKVLLLTSGPDETLYKSGRNIPKLVVRDVANVSTLDVLDAQAVILQDGALAVLSALLGKNGEAQEAVEADVTAAQEAATSDEAAAVEPEAAPTSEPPEPAASTVAETSAPEATAEPETAVEPETYASAEADPAPTSALEEEAGAPDEDVGRRREAAETSDEEEKSA